MNKFIVKTLICRIVLPLAVLAALALGGTWLYGYFGCGRYISVIDRMNLNRISADGYDTAAKAKLGL